MHPSTMYPTARTPSRSPPMLESDAHENDHGAPRHTINVAPGPGFYEYACGRSFLCPYNPPVPYLLRLSRGEVDSQITAAAALRSRQWYQLGPRVEVAAAYSVRERWAEDRLKFFIEFKGKRVLLSEPPKSSILELSRTTPPGDDFFLRYFTELGSGWCCNAPGVVKVDGNDPSSFVFTPNVEILDARGGEVSSIIEQQLGVLAGELEATRQWLDVIAQESTVPGCEDIPADLQDRLEGEVWLRDSTVRCGYTAARGYPHMLFPRCLGDKLFVGAALFSQKMFALHAQLNRDAAPQLQWQGKSPMDLSVNDGLNCLVHRWRNDPAVGFFPVPNPSFGYTDIVYSGMGARLDAWWDELAAPQVKASDSEQTPPRLRYVLHRLEDELIIDTHFPQDHPRHESVEGIMRSGKDYRYRETSAPDAVGYEHVAHYPPLWLARSAHAAAALASAPSGALAQRLASLREELISRFGSLASDEGDDMLEEDDDVPWPSESVSDYVLLLALMPRFHDFSQAPQRVWLPMQLLSSNEDGRN